MDAITSKGSTKHRIHDDDAEDDDNSSCEPGTKSRGTKRTAAVDSKSGTSRRKLRKNDREKQRRFELNNRFEVMSNILNLGQSNKTEKFTILSEAINMISTLTAQNEHLREEKADLRAELAKISCCLQQATFPGSKISHSISSPSAESESSPFDFPQISFTPSRTNLDQIYPGSTRILQLTGSMPFHSSNGNMEDDFDIFSS